MELSAMERAQDKSVITGVFPDDGRRARLTVADDVDVVVDLPITRFRLWETVSEAAMKQLRRPSAAPEPAVPPPGDPHDGWVELCYDLQYQYSLRDFGTPVALCSVTREGGGAQIRLVALGHTRTYPVDLRTFVGISAILEDCVIDFLNDINS